MYEHFRQLFTHNMPECNKEYYSIWLENRSDNLFFLNVCRDDIQHEGHTMESWDTGA